MYAVMATDQLSDFMSYHLTIFREQEYLQRLQKNIVSYSPHFLSEHVYPCERLLL